MNFCYFENPSIAHSIGTTGPLQVGFSACTSPNEHINQIENWKGHMFDFRLISLDYITCMEIEMSDFKNVCTKIELKEQPFEIAKCQF